MAEGKMVQIFDTTLRDGEQSPGATMTREEKLRIARKLDRLGVDIIEAGFPAASPGEVASVRAIAEIVEASEVAALCRTRTHDINAAWESLSTARKPRLHTFIATSDIHLEYKLKMSREEVLEQIAFAVSACRSLCDNVEFSAEDATRSDLGFLKEAMLCAAESGATVVNIPDTVGYALPTEYGAMVAGIRDALVANNHHDVIISTHCHNDLGLAVANSLAAIAAGARQVECCVNGLGERAGNAALEEIVMALRTRKNSMQCDTRLDSRQLLGVSRLVSDITGFVVQPNKAIVGRNAFAHEAGIHQHGMLNERRTYEIMCPEEVGFKASSLVLGKHSGRHALMERLNSLGYDVEDNEALKDVFKRFKALCDSKKDIFDDDLHALMLPQRGGAGADVQRYKLIDIQYRAGLNSSPSALVTVSVDGEMIERECVGDGPVNAAFEAIKACAGVGLEDDAVLRQYQINAVSQGSDAQGKVYIRVRRGRRIVMGRATHTDVVIASAMAFVDALNQHHRLESVEATAHEEVSAAS